MLSNSSRIIATGRAQTQRPVRVRTRR